MEKYKDSNFKTAFPFVVVITLVLGFLLGGISVSLLHLGMSVPEEKSQTSVDFDTNLDLDFIEEVYNTLDQRYIEDLPSSEKMTYGVAKGIISSLDDRYTFFLDPEEAESYLSDRTSDFDGIGVVLGYDGENTYIETVLKDYPAKKAGFKPGDIIVEVDGEEVLGMYPSEVAQKIRGDKGTEVSLQIYREKSKNRVVDIDVVRDRIEVENVTFEDLGNGIFHISISQFSDETTLAFNKSWNKIVDQVVKQNPKGIVLDLRNNPGGYVYSVRYVLEEFLKTGDVVMKEQLRNEKIVTYEDQREGEFESIPLVVLVNEGSASASEILASSIQDNDRGKVVGMPTVGKGVEQELVELSGGSLMLVVFQKWLSPDGRNIDEKNPIKPDVEVDYTMDDYEAGKDPQLDVAKKILK